MEIIAEIILSFFAVVGMMFLIIYICDYYFYRNFNEKLILNVDLRNKSIEECIDIFELITSVRQTTIGKAAIGFVSVKVQESDEETEHLAKEYMRIFKIPGKVLIVDHQQDNLPTDSF